MSSFQLFKRTRNIRSAAKQMEPDALWVKQTRETLLMQVKNSQPAKPEVQTALGRSFKIFVPVISFKWMRAPAAIAMAIVIALFGGSLFSVSAAERALPGDFLYSIKLVTEQARIAFVKEPDEKVKLKTEFTKRRVDEMKQVIASPLPDKSDRVKQAAEALKRDMDTIKNQLDDVKNTSTPEKVKEAAKMVDEKTAEVIVDLQASKAQLSASEKVKLSEAQAAASDTSVKAIEVLVQTHEEDAELVTEEEVLSVLKTHNEKVSKTVTESTGLKLEIATTTTAIPEVATTSSTSATETTSSTEEVAEESSTESADSAASNPQEQLSDAAKSFSEADQKVAEKNLDEAVVLIKEGTQKAFAAQKAVEEDAAKQEAENQDPDNSAEASDQTDETESLEELSSSSTETVEESSNTEEPSDTETNQ